MHPIKIHIWKWPRSDVKKLDLVQIFVYTCATNSDLCQMWAKKNQILCQCKCQCGLVCNAPNTFFSKGHKDDPEGQRSFPKEVAVSGRQSSPSRKARDVVSSFLNVKGIVHFEIKMWYLSAYPKGIQDVGVFFSSVDPILMFLGQTVLVCQSYNGRYRSLSL